MFYDKFKSLCDQKGVSPKRAVTEMGLSNSLATKWKKTGATPNTETLIKVAAYFEVSVEDLIDGKATPLSDSLFPDSITGILVKSSKAIVPATVPEGGLSERAKGIGRAFDAAAPELQKVIESALAGASAVVPDVVKIKITCPINQTEQVIYQPVYRIGNKVLPERGNNGCEMCHPCEECRICRLRAAASLLDGNAE